MLRRNKIKLYNTTFTFYENVIRRIKVKYLKNTVNTAPVYNYNTRTHEVEKNDRKSTFYRKLVCNCKFYHLFCEQNRKPIEIKCGIPNPALDNCYTCTLYRGTGGSAIETENFVKWIFNNGKVSVISHYISVLKKTQFSYFCTHRSVQHILFFHFSLPAVISSFTYLSYMFSFIQLIHFFLGNQPPHKSANGHTLKAFVIFMITLSRRWPNSLAIWSCNPEGIKF